MKTHKHQIAKIVIRSLLILSLGLFYSPFGITAEKKPVDQDLKKFLQASLAKESSFDDKFDAQVWLLSMQKPLSRFVKDKKERLKLLEMIHRESQQNGLKPEIVLAVIQIESGFNPYAISRVGAQGLMQVMPFWKDEIGRRIDNLTDITTNLSYGCAILKFYLDKEKGRLAPALARYNGSYGRSTYSDKVIKVWNKYWRRGSLEPQ